jgi:hypothetical protein
LGERKFNKKIGGGDFVIPNMSCNFTVWPRTWNNIKVTLL